MWRSVVLLLLAGMFFSCEKEPITECNTKDFIKNPYYVTEKEALKHLESQLALLGNTRAARNVASVDPIIENQVTRSADNETVIGYIANFENGGYAVLGADVRQSPVVALCDLGSLSTADLYAAKNNCGGDPMQSENLANFVHASVLAYLERQIKENGTPGILFDANGNPVERRIIDPGQPSDDEWEIVLCQNSLLTTQWTQWYPFNTDCPVINGVQAPVGCVALAVGKLLAYNKKMSGVGPSAIRACSSAWGSSTPILHIPNWTILTQAIGRVTPNAGEQTEMARYLSALGKAMNMEYGVAFSTTDSENAANFLREIAGYKNVVLRSYTETIGVYDDMARMVYQEKRPVFFRANATQNNDEFDIMIGSGHAWIVDGWKELRQQMDNGLYYGRYEVYCRFGYGGGLDGWYAGPVFSVYGNSTKYISYDLF